MAWNTGTGFICLFGVTPLQCLRIRDIFYGSGSADPYPWLKDPAPDPVIFVSAVTFKMTTENYYFSKFFCFLLFNATFTFFFKYKKVIKNKRSHKTVGIKVFRSRIRIRTILCSNGSGRPKNIRILGIRICNTAPLWGCYFYITLQYYSSGSSSFAECLVFLSELGEWISCSAY